MAMEGRKRAMEGEGNGGGGDGSKRMIPLKIG